MDTVDADEKTPPQGPFAMHLARIEQKIDALHARQDHALSRALEAHQLAKTAIRMRESWGPYAVSALAFAVAFATACAVYAK